MVSSDFHLILGTPCLWSDTQSDHYATCTSWEIPCTLLWLKVMLVWTRTFQHSLIYVYIFLSDLTDKMKRSFFQAAVVSILLYGCTTWTLTKRLEKKLDGHYTRMLRAILNKILVATPHKTPTIRPPASYHENYPC